MVDIRELQKRGVVRIPKKEFVVPTNSEGFVEFGSSKPSEISKSSSKDIGFFGSNSSTKETFSTETNGYNKREVDTKITNLDNKIYKMEQRIELLEKKVGVGSSTDSNVGGMIGW